MFKNSFLQNLLILSVYFLISCILTYPLIFKINTHCICTPYIKLPKNINYRGYIPEWIMSQNYTLPDPDILLGIWVISWGINNILHNPAKFFEGNIFSPWKNSLLSGDLRLGDILVALFLSLFIKNPLAKFNILVLLYFSFCGFNMFLLLKYLIKNKYAAFIGGCIFAFLPYHFSQLEHAIFKLTWLPLIILYLTKFLHTSKKRYIYLCLFFTLLQIFCSWNVWFFTMFTVYLYLIIYFLSTKKLEKKCIKITAGYLVTIILITIPLLFPYIKYLKHYKGILHDWAYLWDYLLPAPNNKTYSWLYPFFVRIGHLPLNYAIEFLPEHALFSGFFISLLFLTGVFLILSKRSPVNIHQKVFLLSLTFLCILLSFGPSLRLKASSVRGIYLPINDFIYRYLFQSALRVPCRMYLLLTFPLSIICSISFHHLLSKISSKKYKIILLTGGTIIIILESWSAPIELTPLPQEKLPIYKKLEGKEDISLIELPTGYKYLEYCSSKKCSPQIRGLSAALIESKYMYLSIFHKHKIFNGYNAIPPSQYQKFLRIIEKFPQAESIDIIKNLNIDFIILHPYLYNTKDRKIILSKIESLKNYNCIEYIKKVKQDYLIKLNYSKKSPIKDFSLWKILSILKNSKIISSYQNLSYLNLLQPSNLKKYCLSLSTFKMAKEYSLCYLSPLRYGDDILISHTPSSLMFKLPLYKENKTLLIIEDNCFRCFPFVKIHKGFQEFICKNFFILGRWKIYPLPQNISDDFYFLHILFPKNIQNKSFYIIRNLYIINVK